MRGHIGAVGHQNPPTRSRQFPHVQRQIVSTVSNVVRFCVVDRCGELQQALLSASVALSSSFLYMGRRTYSWRCGPFVLMLGRAPFGQDVFALENATGLPKMERVPSDIKERERDQSDADLARWLDMSAAFPWQERRRCCAMRSDIRRLRRREKHFLCASWCTLTVVWRSR